MSINTPRHAETLVAHADRGIDLVSDVAPPIHQTAPFRASSDDEFAAMSVELRTGFDGAQAFPGAMDLVSRAVSFGGFESLATQPGAMWSGSVGASKAAEAGITAGLIRLSIGLEHPSDLIADLDRALHAAAKRVTENRDPIVSWTRVV